MIHKTISNLTSRNGGRATCAAAVLALAALFGCSARLPSCSEESTTSVVKKIYQDSISQLLAASPASADLRAKIDAATEVAFNTVLTVGKDEKIGKVSCEADISIKVPEVLAKAIGTPGNLLSAGAQPLGIKANGNRIEKSIQYTAQVTDDQKQISVSTIGVSDMGQFVASLALGGLFNPSEPVAAPNGQAPAAPATADTAETMVNTRFGALKIDGGQQVLFKGVPLSPGLEAGDHLRIVKTFQVGDRDAVLIEAINGTLCPSNLYIATVSATGIAGTPSFGTCSDEWQVSQVGDAVRITMSGFAPNSSSKAEQEAAANEVHAFVYRNGTVNEEARPKAAAAAPAGPSFSCAGKLSPAEKLICDTPALADADAKLGRLYAVALSKASDPMALKQQQRDWQRIRTACADTICMTDTYGKRLAELSK